MGYRVGSECRVTLSEVAEEMCAGMSGVSAAGIVRCVGVTPAAGGYLLDFETTSGGTTTQSSLSVPQVPCNENEAYEDMGAVWALALVAVVGVYLLKELVVRHLMPQ